MREPLTGKACDSTHPFPAPLPREWADSMEYGADRRQPTDNEFATQDVDTSPVWRALGAWIWDTDCRTEHIREVAESSILTTHLLAAAMLSRATVNPIEALAFGQSGGNDAIEALVKGGGLEPAHEQIALMNPEGRRELVGECLALVMKGHLGLQLDLEARYGR